MEKNGFVCVFAAFFSILICLSTGCTGVPEEPGETPAGTAAKTPEPTKAAYTGTKLPYDFSDQMREIDGCIAMKAALDLDGDGAEELSVAVREGSREFQLQLADGDKRYEGCFAEGDFSLINAMVSDLDPTDGAIEIFVSVDCDSADYTTYGWRYDGKGLVEIVDPDKGHGGIYGLLHTAENGTVTLCRSLDLLGTWWGEQAFAVEGDAPAFCQKGDWVRANSLWGEEASLVAAIPLTVQKQEGGELTVPAGETLSLLSAARYEDHFDALFALADGSRVILRVDIIPEMDDWYNLSVNGRPEAECFTFLPYSG